MKIAILGFDLEGRSSFDYFTAQGHELTICDQNPEVKLPPGVASVVGDNYLDNLNRFDLIVRTAGLPPEKILKANPGVAQKITTQINEFMKICPTKNVIGITGTKGKGTTSTLVSKMLEATGKTVRLGGNIGVPPLTFLSELKDDSWVVLELSSFQLIDLKHSPHIAVCLMVVPEHLDWHKNINEYTTAKSQLFVHQESSDIAIYFADNELSKLVASSSHGQKIAYFKPPGAYVDDGYIVIDDQTICPVSELKLLGEHNWQNVCAAVTAVWQVTKNKQVIRDVLTSFSGLEHRLELVRELDGIRYYNDSFASTPDATIAALNTIAGQKVLIVGGFDRDLPIKHLVQAIVDHSQDIRKLIIIGASARRLAHELKEVGFSNYSVLNDQNMSAIIKIARDQALIGDALILSPGFASFDMFKNFEDRGQQFKQAVSKL